MVTEKDAAKKRVLSMQERRRKSLEELEKMTLKIEYGISEVTPAYNSGGYYDVDVPEKRVRVSPWFDTEEEANEWRDRHEPDEGKRLVMCKRRLVERHFTEWLPF